MAISAIIRAILVGFIGSPLLNDERRVAKFPGYPIPSRPHRGHRCSRGFRASPGGDRTLWRGSVRDWSAAISFYIRVRRQIDGVLCIAHSQYPGRGSIVRVNIIHIGKFSRGIEVADAHCQGSLPAKDAVGHRDDHAPYGGDFPRMDGTDRDISLFCWA
jgi:hypothetical protein